MVSQGMHSTGGGGPARVPNLRVWKHLSCGVAHAGGEGRINVLPWYRPVGVAKNLQLDAKEEERGCPKGVSGRPRGTGMTVLTYPGLRPGSRQGWSNVQVRWAAAHPGQDRRLPSVVTHSRPWRATARTMVGIFLEDGSGSRSDWVIRPVVLLCRQRDETARRTVRPT